MSRSVRLAAKANSIATQVAATDTQLRQAAQLLEQAESASPRATTWLQIGRAYMELGDFASSHRAYDQARAQLKNNPALELFCAILAMDENDCEKAQQYIDALKEICPANQALQTAQALCFLLQNRVAEALQLLRPKSSKGQDFDITVSPLLVSRLAAIVESYILPRELPARDLVDMRKDVPKECIAKQTGGGITDTTDAEKVDGGTTDTAKAEKVDGGTTDTTEAALNTHEANIKSGISDPRAFVKELEHKLPSLPMGVVLGKFSLQRGGTDRLQRAWDMEPQQRTEQFTIAVHELLRSYERAPKAYQAAFCLAEGLLALAEYGRDRSKGYGVMQLTWLRAAERLLHEALICDKDIAFASHYLARTQLFQYRFAEAEKLWRQALAEFEKLPEAQYGLGQALLMSGRKREGRLCIASAVNADMRLLRDRLADLAQLEK